MTQRLYYHDAYTTEFDAKVVDRRDQDRGVGLVLNHTFFYPSSGGQPFDVGWIGDIPVIDVFEDGEEIVHVVERDVAGPDVTGRIDWDRRFDHMQQHTGQHLLSAAFHDLIGAMTISFHLGDETCTIDLAVKDLSSQDVERVEQQVNQVVFENRPIEAHFYKPDELDALSLRKPSTKDENIRIISVQGFDHSACGGTHCRSTGQVGPVKVRRWQRYRQGMRVEFLCGWRALRDYEWKHATITQVANAFSIQDREVAETALRMGEELGAARKNVSALQSQMLDYEAQLFSGQGVEFQGYTIVSLILDRDAEQVRRLALRIAEQGRHVALLGAEEPTGRLFFARSPEVPCDMVRMLREVCQEFGGGGGGQPNAAQGGGVASSRLAEAIDFALAKVRDTLHDHSSGGTDR